MKEIPQQDNVMKYFRARIKGNSCEKCGRAFEEGDIIFTPEQVSHEGEKMVRYFCGSPHLCGEIALAAIKQNYESKR